MDDELRPALRTAQSWWVASELVRPHPHLTLIETHPGGGLYDCLSVVDATGGKPRTLVDLNRHGRMHVPVASDFRPLDWGRTVTDSDAHEVVRELEAAAQLTPPARTPVTGPAVLVHRLAARVLAGLVNERESWDVRSEVLDTSGDGGGLRGYLSGFASATQAVRTRLPDDLMGEPAFRFWALLRDERAVAVWDTAGTVHTAGGPRDAMAVYAGNGRSLTRTAAHLLGDVLP